MWIILPGIGLKNWIPGPSSPISGSPLPRNYVQTDVVRNWQRHIGSGTSLGASTSESSLNCLHGLYITSTILYAVISLTVTNPFFRFSFLVSHRESAEDPFNFGDHLRCIHSERSVLSENAKVDRGGVAQWGWKIDVEYRNIIVELLVLVVVEGKKGAKRRG
ncbi:hypothetical protein M413DRAFT_13431 [Hebeloma cylindrosporum]|uniref:Uncharacterized protein n=1 Tax=Hebeloma cylindrosporum TaxID=76867 RepID=A0A0C3C0R2_HEBCY|nr:hypothetical protein M413DRAFT_13431 [Hebeloma cylindrosporum h7]